MIFFNLNGIKKLLAAVIIAAALLTGVHPAQASLAVDFTAPADLFNKADTGSDINIIGWQFNVINDLTVNSLGYYCGKGCADAHNVGLYESTGKLLASTTVTSGDLMLGNALWRFHSIASVTLLEGSSYILAATVGNDSYTADIGDTYFTGLAWNPDIVFITDVFDSINSILPSSWTSSESVGVMGGFGPNMAQVPEFDYLICFGLIGLAGLRLRFNREY